jgi:hypothetical protein
MGKRSVGRVGRKGTGARKRNTVKDLSARKARRVVGGLLPAVKPAREALPASPSPSSVPQETVSFSYSKVQF